MKKFEDIRLKYEEDTGQKIVGWVDDYSLWLEDFILKPKKTKFAPPTEKDIIEYFLANGYSEQSAKRAYQYYSMSNWKDSNGRQVKNWKQKMFANWFKDENKIKGKSLEEKYKNQLKNID